MTFVWTKERLKNYSHIPLKIEQLTNLMLDCQERAESITSSFADMGNIRGKGGTSDKVGNNACLMTDYKKQIDELKAQYYDIEKNVMELATTDAEISTILCCLYIEELTLKEVAKKMKVDTSTIQRKQDQFFNKQQKYK